MEKVQNISEVVNNIQKLANKHNSAQIGLIKLDRLAYKTQSYNDLSSWLKEAMINNGLEKKSEAVRHIGDVMTKNISADDHNTEPAIRLWQTRLNYLLALPQKMLFVGYSLKAPYFYTKVSLNLMNKVFDDIKVNF